jgi:hypothetical protein
LKIGVGLALGLKIGLGLGLKIEDRLRVEERIRNRIEDWRLRIREWELRVDKGWWGGGSCCLFEFPASSMIHRSKLVVFKLAHTSFKQKLFPGLNLAWLDFQGSWASRVVELGCLGAWVLCPATIHSITMNSMSLFLVAHAHTHTHTHRASPENMTVWSNWKQTSIAQNLLEIFFLKYCPIKNLWLIYFETSEVLHNKKLGIEFFTSIA